MLCSSFKNTEEKTVLPIQGSGSRTHISICLGYDWNGNIKIWRNCPAICQSFPFNVDSRARGGGAHSNLGYSCSKGKPTVGYVYSNQSPLCFQDWAYKLPMLAVPSLEGQSHMAKRDKNSRSQWGIHRTSKAKKINNKKWGLSKLQIMSTKL